MDSLGVRPAGGESRFRVTVLPEGLGPRSLGTTRPINARREMAFAAFGDSVMWGQGLRRGDRFSFLIAGALARADGSDAVMVVGSIPIRRHHQRS